VMRASMSCVLDMPKTCTRRMLKVFALVEGVVTQRLVCATVVLSSFTVQRKPVTTSTLLQANMMRVNPTVTISAQAEVTSTQSVVFVTAEMNSLARVARKRNAPTATVSSIPGLLETRAMEEDRATSTLESVAALWLRKAVLAVAQMNVGTGPNAELHTSGSHASLSVVQTIALLVALVIIKTALARVPMMKLAILTLDLLVSSKAVHLVALVVESVIALMVSACARTATVESNVKTPSNVLPRIW